MKGDWIRRPADKTTVVFVHGVLSDGDTCWRHEDGSYWPELLADAPDLKSAGIYVFTYRTDLFSGTYRLGDVVDALKEHMRLDGVLGSSRLAFVCHSMGGIVVRKFLVERQADLVAANAEIGLFLVASPSLGSSYADWVAPLAALVGHSQVSALRFVRGNDWLMDLDKEFTNLKEAGILHIHGKELVEDRFIIAAKFWRRQVVEPFAGARYFGEPFKVPGSDHISIAKPVDHHAVQHRLLVQFVSSMLTSDGASALPAEPVVMQVLNSDIEALHYSAREATLRFSVTNVACDTVKIAGLRLDVTRTERVRQIRLTTPGAPHVDYALSADISESTSEDLLSGTNAQFILKHGESDAFAVAVLGREGVRYHALLECRVESLTTRTATTITSEPVRITYPVRTVEALRDDL